MKLSHAFALTCSFVLSTAAASSANAAANPAGIAFKSQTNVSLYGKPTGLMITGRCNRYASPFMTMRTKGGEVLAYLNPTSRPDGHVCALDKAFYMNNYGAVPLWPWPSYGQRQIYANSRMADIRVGTKWSNYVVAYAEKLMRERKVDGIFLDVVGARPWGISNWSNWSKTEKDAWTKGTVDLVRRIDAKRRAINPNFLLLNNNIWDRGDGSTIGFAAEKYVDGVILEHPPGVTAYHAKYVKRAFSNLGHRRVMIIARNTTEAKAWAAAPGVTHVSNQASSHYAYPTVPPISFRALSDR
jgi:hypothetical protein